MATATGTATDYLDFWNKLIAFLTTNATLVAAGQQWSVAWTAPVGAPNSTDIVLKGPGMSGSDEVFVGLRLETDVVGDRFTIFMTGMTGVLAGATEYDQHVNCTPYSVRFFLGSIPMGYWFVANGRRFVAVAKISTVYQVMYGGLALPYSMPENYPYPMFIGGMTAEGSPSADWRSVSADHSCFVRSKYSSISYQPSAWLLGPDGLWLRATSYGSTTEGNIALAPDNFGTEDYGMGDGTFGNTNYGYKEFKDRIVQAYGGNFPLYPITLVRSAPGSQTYAILHGIHYVPGRGNSAENTVLSGGKTYLVMQNAFRTLTGDYFAVHLEA